MDFIWDGTTLCEQTTLVHGHSTQATLTWDHQGLAPLTQRERRTAAQDPQHEIDERFFAIVTDLVGTPTELLDEQGAIAARTRTTLWGTTTWNASATAHTPLRFPGQYFDPETELHYNYFRTYDPETARFLTPDPLGLSPAPNPSTYVHNPHTWTDPLGLAPYKWDPAKVDEHYDKHAYGEGARDGKPDMPECQDQHDNDDGFGRYVADSEALFRDPKPPEGVREATRSHDQAVLRMDPEGRLAIAHNGRITSYFRPGSTIAEARKYMDNESQR